MGLFIFYRTTEICDGICLFSKDCVPYSSKHSNLLVFIKLNNLFYLSEAEATRFGLIINKKLLLIKKNYLHNFKSLIKLFKKYRASTLVECTNWIERLQYFRFTTIHRLDQYLILSLNFTDLITITTWGLIHKVHHTNFISFDLGRYYYPGYQD